MASSGPSKASHSALSTPTTPTNSDWIADTGATAYMTPHRHWLRDYEPYVTPIRCANSEVVYSVGRGTVVFAPVIGGKAAQYLSISSVLHVPSLSSNLLSVLRLTKHHGVAVRMEKGQMSFHKAKQVVLTASICKNAPVLDGATVPAFESVLSTTSVNARIDRPLLHRRLGHAGADRVERLIKQELVQGISITGKAPVPSICEPCLAGKQHRDPFPDVSFTRAKLPPRARPL